MDIKQLNYFVKICQKGSFSKASQELYLTQQALSKAIMKLELDLNQPLFNRSKKGVTLTEFGEFLWDRSVDLLNAYKNLNKEINYFQISSKGIIRLGVAVGMISYITPDMIMEFRKSNPYVQVEMQETSNTDCEQRVLEEMLDMAVVLKPIDQDRDKFDVTLLKTHYMVAVINKSNALAGKPYIVVRDLEGQNLLLNGERNRYNLELICRKNGFEPNIVGSSYQMVALLSLVDSRDYVAFCVDFNAIKYTNLSNLCFVPFHENAYYWEMCLITKKRRPMSKETQALMRHIIDSICEESKTPNNILEPISAFAGSP